MTGTEKQVAWAEYILRPAKELIAQLPDGIRERHERGLANLGNASKVINCRYAVTGWCERVQEWISVQVTHDVSEDDAMKNGTPAAFTLAGTIDSVVF